MKVAFYFLIGLGCLYPLRRLFSIRRDPQWTIAQRREQSDGRECNNRHQCCTTRVGAASAVTRIAHGKSPPPAHRQPRGHRTALTGPRIPADRRRCRRRRRTRRMSRWWRDLEHAIASLPNFRRRKEDYFVKVRFAQEFDSSGPSPTVCVVAGTARKPFQLDLLHKHGESFAI